MKVKMKDKEYDVPPKVGGVLIEEGLATASGRMSAWRPMQLQLRREGKCGTVYTATNNRHFLCDLPSGHSGKHDRAAKAV